MFAVSSKCFPMKCLLTTKGQRALDGGETWQLVLITCSESAPPAAGYLEVVSSFIGAHRDASAPQNLRTRKHQAVTF